MDDENILFKITLVCLFVWRPCLCGYGGRPKDFRLFGPRMKLLRFRNSSYGLQGPAGPVKNQKTKKLRLPCRLYFHSSVFFPENGCRNIWMMMEATASMEMPMMA